MNLNFLSSIGLPYGSSSIEMRLPEEVMPVSAAQVADKSSKVSAAPVADKSSKQNVKPVGKVPAAPKPPKAEATPKAAAEADNTPSEGKNFLEKWIDADFAPGGRCHGKKFISRFPPEPNGYLHIGHAKAILNNFGLAQKYNGQCNLRFDDTNPSTEEIEYVESIKEDVRWVCESLQLEQCKNGGMPWRDGLFWASDYFDQMHAFAVDLIKQGKAYVDSQSEEQMKLNRGGVARGSESKEERPGVNSPFRDRSIEENLKLFTEMQEGKHAEGSVVLRAKIDMSHPNMNMRDPPMYRVKFDIHHNTKDKWKVYPIYDFAHGNEDAIEGVTHSMCTLEFENHRELYDWFINNTSIIPSKPVQKEYARLEIEGAVTSKRKLLKLVKDKHVAGWDDPRLLTIVGLKRRGVRPTCLKNLMDTVGTTNKNSTVPWELVEDCWRTDLEPISLRRLVVLDPLLVEIVSYKGTEKVEDLADFPDEGNPGGKRSITFSDQVYIDRSDYMEDAPADYFRLSTVGSEVKLRYCYVIKLEEVVKDKQGKVTKLKCSHDPATRDVMPADRKPKVVQWVNAKDCVDAEVRLVNPLFVDMPKEMPAGKDFIDYLNPSAMVTCSAKAESNLTKCKADERFQFERCGFFSPDYDCWKDPKKLIFNRIVALKESTKKPKAEGAKSASRKDQQAAAAAEKDRLQRIPPAEFFKSERGDEFSAFDADGMPTHDKDGKEVTKNAKKKLEKDLEKHKKLHEAWKATA